MHDQNNSIPSLDLVHNDQKVTFAFRTMEEIFEKRGNTPDVPHRHNYYTVLLGKKVCGLHYIDYVEFPIKPNCIFFVNPGQVHQVITYGEPEGVVIMFSTEFLSRNHISEDFLTNLGLFSSTAATPPLEISPDAGKDLENIVENIKNVFHDTNPFRADLLGAYLKVFLIECNKLLPVPNIENTQVLEAGKIILRSFKGLVEKHFATWHKVSEYASELNITPDYLNSSIKNAIGKTAKEFIQERIILESKRLGIHTQLSNKEIAFQVGFDDPSHFSKFFKKTEGKSFSDFRTQLEKSMVEQ